MKKEKVKIVKEKFYGFSIPNEHEEKIMWMGHDELISYIEKNNLPCYISLPATRKEIVEIILEKTKVQDVTVCLVLDNADNWARGVTVFNRDEDVYDEAVGRTQARNYALRALKGRIIDRNEFEREQAVETLMRTKCPFTNKGERKPELNMYERGLLFGKDFKEKYGKVRVRWFNTMKLPIIGSDSSRVIIGGFGGGGSHGSGSECVLGYAGVCKSW